MESASRRRRLWIWGLVALALFAVLAVFDVQMRDAGGPGIIGFELAGSEERAREILADWGDDGRDAARWSLWLDYPFLIANAIFWTLAVLAVRDAATARRQTRFARFGTAIARFPLAAATLDAMENVGLLLTLGRHAGDFAPRLAAIAATGKFIFSGVALLFVIAGLVMRARRR